MKVHFEDQHLIVLEKPAGLLSQGDASGEESLVDVLRARFGRNYVGLIHRLDRNTSGLMVVAKRSKSAERLTEQLQNGKLSRRYRALLNGKIEGFDGETFHWQDWLLKNEATNTVTRAREGQAGAQEAVLSGKIVKFVTLNGESYTDVELQLSTGRSHQIRAQSAMRGHSVAGDAKYGKFEPSPSFLAAQQLALNSSYLKFEHPMPPPVQHEYESIPSWME